MTPRSVVVLIFILSLIVISCEDRDRDNIFDPKNDATNIEIGFRLTSFDSSVTLSWIPPAHVKYTSTNIFRKTQSDSEPLLLKTLGRGISQYLDKNIIFDNKYTYFLTLNGETEESYPTQNLSITPGPASIWILDTYLWEVNKLNYDLSSIALRKQTFWRPENLAFSKEAGIALVTYPELRSLEIFDIKTGQTKASSDDLERPFDAVYDNEIGKFWLVDSTGFLYSVDPKDANTQSYSVRLSKPIQMDIFNQQLYILDQAQNKIYIYDASPQLVDSVYVDSENLSFNFLKQFRIDKINNNLYFVDADSGNHILYKYDLNNKTITSLIEENNIYSFDINSSNETIWIIIAKHLNSNLVQLSGGDVSRFDISEIERPIDIRVIPVNGNFIITDFKTTENINVPKVFHFRSDVSLIGAYSTYGDPYRIYIE